MVAVGMMITPGHPEQWLEGYVCPKKRCSGYAVKDYRGGVARWPGCTLMAEVPVHANIRGAMKFRDGV